MPIFTVLSPAYNHEKYIGECIQSVLLQSFTDWEMIILDDGSSDKTGEIAAKFALEDSRIKYHSQKNHGIFRLAETYNKGLSMARGRYISILECDDRWEPYKLQRQNEILESRPEVVVCWGRAQALVAETHEIQALSPKEGVNNTTLWPNCPIGTILNALYLENMIPAVTLTIRRSILEEIGGFTQPAEFPTTDLPTLLELALKGEFYFDEAILAQWRVYSIQITKMYPVKMVNQRWKHVLNHLLTCSLAIKSHLTVTEKQINRHFRLRLLTAYATSGRYKLMRGDYSGARKDYLRAIFFPSPTGVIWRLRAITGFFFSLFHLNIEGLARILGKVSYK